MQRQVEGQTIGRPLVKFDAQLANAGVEAEPVVMTREMIQGLLQTRAPEPGSSTPRGLPGGNPKKLRPTSRLLTKRPQRGLQNYEEAVVSNFRLASL